MIRKTLYQYYYRYPVFQDRPGTRMRLLGWPVQPVPYLSLLFEDFLQCSSLVPKVDASITTGTLDQIPLAGHTPFSNETAYRSETPLLDTRLFQTKQPTGARLHSERAEM
jgi:hypothetical protein